MIVKTDSLDWCFQTRFWLKRGYHVIDLSLELPLVREEDFVVVPGLS